MELSSREKVSMFSLFSMKSLFLIVWILSHGCIVINSRIMVSTNLLDDEQWVRDVWNFERLAVLHNNKDVPIPKGNIGWNASQELYKPWGSNRLTPQDAVKALNAVDAMKSFSVIGSFDNLIFNINRKQHIGSIRNKSVAFNILIVGGSVCRGVHCVAIENSGLSEVDFLKLESWCSWSRRFVALFQYALSRIVENNRLVVSSRVCCSGGTTTGTTSCLLLRDDIYVDNQPMNMLKKFFFAILFFFSVFLIIGFDSSQGMQTQS
jgi:hypothetical protein